MTFFVKKTSEQAKRRSWLWDEMGAFWDKLGENYLGLWGDLDEMLRRVFGKDALGWLCGRWSLGMWW